MLKEVQIIEDYLEGNTEVVYAAVTEALATRSETQFGALKQTPDISDTTTPSVRNTLAQKTGVDISVSLWHNNIGNSWSDIAMTDINGDQNNPNWTVFRIAKLMKMFDENGIESTRNPSGALVYFNLSKSKSR